MRLGHELERVGIPIGYLDGLMVPGAERLAELEVSSRLALIRPLPTDILEWIEENIELPAGTGYSSGFFRALPFQRGIFRAFQEDGAQRIWFRKVPRLGWSFMMAVVMLYQACHEGRDVIFYERSMGDAQVFHDSYIEPLLRQSSKLRHLLRPSHLEKWHDRLLTNGAFMRFRSASNDGHMRMINGDVMADEISNIAWWPKGKSNDGDKLERAYKRTQQHADGRMGAGSSPTTKGRCLITENYNQSDKRTLRVPCLCCGTYQDIPPIIMPGENLRGLKYRPDKETGKVALYTDPKTGLTAPDIWYDCVNGHRIRETHKAKMFEHSHWEATTIAAREGFVGFEAWAFHSTDPKSRFHHIIDMYRSALVDPSKRKILDNEWKGIAYDEENARPVEVHYLKDKRTVAYPAPCPPPVRTATISFDNQRGPDPETLKRRPELANDPKRMARSEYTVVGWGEGEEAWVLRHGVIPLPPFSPQSNAAKLAIMKDVYYKPGGLDWVTVAGGFDDIGDGELMDLAVQFVSSREARSLALLGVRGANEAKGNRVPTIRAGKGKFKAFEYDVIGTQAAKDTLFRRLHMDGFGPRTIHFPQSFDVPYFESLTAIVLRDLGDGRTWWEDRKGNEALDCLVMNYARMLMLRRNIQAVNLVLQDPVDLKSCLDGVKAEVLDHKGPDRSYQSRLLEDERRATGTTSEHIMVQRRPLSKPSAPPPGPPQHHQPAPSAPAAPTRNPDAVFAAPAGGAPGQEAVRYGRVGAGAGWRR